jgi:hypothetical protein
MNIISTQACYLVSGGNNNAEILADYLAPPIGFAFGGTTGFATGFTYGPAYVAAALKGSAAATLASAIQPVITAGCCVVGFIVGAYVCTAALYVLFPMWANAHQTIMGY